MFPFSSPRVQIPKLKVFKQEITSSYPDWELIIITVVIVVNGADHISKELQMLTGPLFSPRYKSEYGEAADCSDKRKLKDSNSNLSQCHFVHHKSQMN
jgi:hypothetical protein